MRNHELAIHKKIISHICSSCNKEFKMYRALYSHIRNVHLQVKNFACNLCEKRFRRRLELAEHMARHSGEMLYKCLYCPKSFSARTNYLNHHRKLHPNEQIADLLSMLDSSTSLAADITMIMEDKVTISQTASNKRKRTTTTISSNVNNSYNSNNDPSVSSSSYTHVTGDDDIIDNGSNSENNYGDDDNKMIPNFSSTPKCMPPIDLRKTVSCTIVSGENNLSPPIPPMQTTLSKNNTNQSDIDMNDIENQIDTHVVGDLPQTLRMKLDEENKKTNDVDKLENNVNGNIDGV